MYIDENLIRILTPHKGETIDVSYAISLIKTIAKEYEQKQLLLHNVVGQSEQLPNMTLEQAIEKAKPNLDKIKDVDKHIDDIR